MRYAKWRLVLFVVLETLAVAAMVGLSRAGRLPVGHEWCRICRPQYEGLLFGVPALLGELAILAVALKTERPVWAAMLVFGLFSSLAAIMLLLQPTNYIARPRYLEVLALWHFVAGGVLVCVGLIGGIRAGFLRARVRVGYR